MEKFGTDAWWQRESQINLRQLFPDVPLNWLTLGLPGAQQDDPSINVDSSTGSASEEGTCASEKETTDRKFSPSVEEKPSDRLPPWQMEIDDLRRNSSDGYRRASTPSFRQGEDDGQRDGLAVRQRTPGAGPKPSAVANQNCRTESETAESDANTKANYGEFRRLSGSARTRSSADGRNVRRNTENPKAEGVPPVECERETVKTISECEKRGHPYFKGVSEYGRSLRWEAFIWYPTLKKQLWLGQHFIADAAARSYDKAQLVLRDRSKIKLNYAEEDYVPAAIEMWKTWDVTDFVDEIRKHSVEFSDGCVAGLTVAAAQQLLDKIREAKAQIILGKFYD